MASQDEKRIDEKANQHEPSCAWTRGWVECPLGGRIESNYHTHLLLPASPLAVALSSPTTHGGRVYLSLSIAYNRYKSVTTSVTIHRRHQRECVRVIFPPFSFSDAYLPDGHI